MATTFGDALTFKVNRDSEYEIRTGARECDFSIAIKDAAGVTLKVRLCGTVKGCAGNVWALNIPTGSTCSYGIPQLRRVGPFFGSMKAALTWLRDHARFETVLVVS